jgi:replicative DNA helicase
MIDHEDHTVSIRAEQAVLGALLVDNDAIDRCADLAAEHFYREDHRLIFGEMQRQIAAGNRADPMTLMAALADRVADCLKYCATMRMSAASAANIATHATIVREKADKRALAAIAIEAQELAASMQDSASCVDLVASKLEALTQRKTQQEPRLIADTMVEYLTMIQERADGLHKPISTGHLHLDELLGGGLERGTMTVVAGRPGTGKTAFGLGIARNVAMDGLVSAILSMEMAAKQINDRNMAALGQIPLSWLKAPKEEGQRNSKLWDQLSFAAHKASQLNMWIDEQAGMNMMELRAKARKMKRKTGLDLLVVDQLSFINGGDADQEWQRIGQYTRGLIDIAKSLDIAIILLAQLNRKCEDRSDKRPIMSDLAQSGSIEQDAANILLLYRDELHNSETHDKEIAEINAVKQRQGSPGVIGMKYNGMFTMFEDLPYRWERKAPEQSQKKSRGGFN